MWSLKRALVATLSNVDSALDEVLYRPAVVKAFHWVPRWWNCDVAKLSIALDDRWATGYWRDGVSIFPGAPCDACGRRASIHVYGGLEPGDEPIGDYLDEHPIRTCGWCHAHGPMCTETDVARALAEARADSIAWRWRWGVRS